MNRDETNRILRARSSLTSQPYGADTVDAWHEALTPWTYAAARTALTRAAIEEKRITVAHLVERLPSREPDRQADDIRPDPHCQTCDGTGIDRRDPNGHGYACRCWWHGTNVTS